MAAQGRPFQRPGRVHIKAAPPASRFILSRAWCRTASLAPCGGSLPASPPTSSMKAFSPVRSVRKNSLSDHSLGISRSKTPVDDPMSLLYNMHERLLLQAQGTGASIPQNKVTKMEILQHVIDYILDLQIALDSHPTIVSLHHQRPGQNQTSRTPLTTLNTDISILSLQVRLARQYLAARKLAVTRAVTLKAHCEGRIINFIFETIVR